MSDRQKCVEGGCLVVVDSWGEGVYASYTRTLDFRWFDVNQDGVARLVFEGVSDSGYCLEQPTNCFLEVTLEDASGIVVMSQKLYMSLHSIKTFYDHRTAGSGENQQPLANLFQYQQPQDILRLTPETPQNSNKHILFVHGWRMQFEERENFAETALKRLYWSGYDGKFSFLSWPTDYFRNPAYWSDTDSNVAALSDIQNYSRSEAIARRTAPLLMQWLEEIGPHVRVFAHSMGNVVVSEALRQYTGTNLTNKYVASQAAEVAGAYDPNVENLNVKLPLDELPELIVPNECQGRPQFDVAWRCMNNDSGNVQDIPPDKYRYTIPNPHVTNPNSGPQYYNGIASKAGSIVNFHNLDDIALEAWRIQQVTKPDAGGLVTSGDPTWTYTWIEDTTQPGFYFDHFKVDPPGLGNTQELTWDGPEVGGRGNPEILAHIIPGRTPPLGHVGTTAGVVGTQVDLNASFQFTDSRYDHSAQFLSDFATRQTFWARLLTNFELTN